MDTQRTIYWRLFFFYGWSVDVVGRSWLCFTEQNHWESPRDETDITISIKTKWISAIILSLVIFKADIYNSFTKDSRSFKVFSETP